MSEWERVSKITDPDAAPVTKTEVFGMLDKWFEHSDPQVEEPTERWQEFGRKVKSSEDYARRLLSTESKFSGWLITEDDVLFLDGANKHSASQLRRMVEERRAGGLNKTPCPIACVINGILAYRKANGGDTIDANVIESGNAYYPRISQVPKIIDWVDTAVGECNDIRELIILDDKAEGMKLSGVAEIEIPRRQWNYGSNRFVARMVQPNSESVISEEGKMSEIEIGGRMNEDVVNSSLDIFKMDSRSTLRTDMTKIGNLACSLQTRVEMGPTELLRFVSMAPDHHLERWRHQNKDRVKRMVMASGMMVAKHPVWNNWRRLIDISGIDKKDEYGEGMYAIGRARWYNEMMHKDYEVDGEKHHPAFRYTSGMFLHDGSRKGRDGASPIVQQFITTAERIVNSGGGLEFLERDKLGRVKRYRGKNVPNQVPVMLHPMNADVWLWFSVEGWAKAMGMKYPKKKAYLNSERKKIMRGLDATIEYLKGRNGTVEFAYKKHSQHPIGLRATDVYREVVSKPQSSIMTTISFRQLLKIIEDGDA